MNLTLTYRMSSTQFDLLYRHVGPTLLTEQFRRMLDEILHLRETSGNPTGDIILTVTFEVPDQIRDTTP